MFDTQLTQVQELCSHLTCQAFGKTFNIIVERDKKRPDDGRIYLQVEYTAPCTKTGKEEPWKGGKHYLSDHMTEDEIVKKVYVAFEMAVKHEVMEGFKFDGIIVFNPHVNFRALLTVSDQEIKRL